MADRPSFPKSKNPEPHDQNRLSARDLTVCVKKGGKINKILKNISFHIDEGEILGLAGESGCGKSVTALSISALLPEEIKITEGEIIYKGFNIACPLGENKTRGVRTNEISVVFQDARQALNPLMKAGFQIREALDLSQIHDQPTGKSRQRAENKSKSLELLSSLGFDNPEKVYNAYPHQLSGGMCQRIMTAIAIIRYPKLLLADELSSSLDEESLKRCMSLLLEMNQNNKMSVLLISHDLQVIQKYCGRYLIMYAGRIIEEGQAASLFNPLHPYTKALVNAIPNYEKRGKTLECIGGITPSVEDQTEGCPFSPRCSRAENICRQNFPAAKKIKDKTVYCNFPENRN